MEKNLGRTKPQPFLMSTFCQIPWSLYQMFKSISLVALLSTGSELNLHDLLLVFFVPVYDVIIFQGSR